MLPIVGALALGACGSPAGETLAPAPSSAAPEPAALDPAVLDDPSRPEAERNQDAGLDNVELAMKLADVPTASVDVAVAVRSYHDVEWTFPQYTRADQLAELFRIIKPGGIMGIVEVATPVAGWDEAAHRLNKQVVIDDFIGAGFERVEESDLLANPNDDHTIDGFPHRHETDRYVLRFRKTSS